MAIVNVPEDEKFLVAFCPACETSFQLDKLGANTHTCPTPEDTNE